MPRFAANLSMLFADAPLLERFERAARAGFTAVELAFPYAYAVKDLMQRLQASGLTLVMHYLPSGNWDAGERGIACLPDRVREFRDGVAQGITYAQALGVTQLNCLAGKAPRGISDAALRHTFVENLRYAAREMRAAGINLLIEPVNTLEYPTSYLQRTPQAVGILDQVGANNAFLLYDVYHAQRSEGELAATLQKFLPRIAHIQVADNPGRNEPGTGEINFPFLFEHLDRIGYGGWIGCEYKPATATEAGLGWLAGVSTDAQ
jgi:hydroxypyruvate isomerase